MSSCLGKLFCLILNEGLLKFTKANNSIHPSQKGFLPGHRTADHILTILTLTRKRMNDYIHVLSISKKLSTWFGTTAHRAMNSTRKKLDICKLPPHLAVKIFDSIISPILLYNPEVWALLQTMTSTNGTNPQLK